MSSHSLHTLSSWLNGAFHQLCTIHCALAVEAAITLVHVFVIIVTVSSVWRVPYICILSSLLSTQLPIWSLRGGITITVQTPFVTSYTGYLSIIGLLTHCAFSSVSVFTVMLHRILWTNVFLLPWTLRVVVYSLLSIIISRTRGLILFDMVNAVSAILFQRLRISCRQTFTIRISFWKHFTHFTQKIEHTVMTAHLWGAGLRVSVKSVVT